MKEAIVLAGGFGTRLAAMVPDLPKPMAPVNGRPFLAYLLDALIGSGFDLAVLAVGYRSGRIREHFGERHRSLPLRYSVEDVPLGTGGAIRRAMTQIGAADFLVLNGDTWLDVDHAAMLAAHVRARSRLTVAVHAVDDAARFGALDIDGSRIRSFREKGRGGPGSINAGVYALSGDIFANRTLPAAFSFETDFLVPHVGDIAPLAFPADGLFIDIGVPEDYERAQRLLAPRLGSGSDSGVPE